MEYSVREPRSSIPVKGYSMPVRTGNVVWQNYEKFFNNVLFRFRTELNGKVNNYFPTMKITEDWPLCLHVEHWELLLKFKRSRVYSRIFF